MNRVENILTKGEIAHFEQFLILSHCFQKPSAAEALASICMRESVKVQLVDSYFYFLVFDPFLQGDRECDLHKRMMKGVCRTPSASNVDPKGMALSYYTVQAVTSVKQSTCINSFPHTVNMQQTTLKMSRQNYVKSL